MIRLATVADLPAILDIYGPYVRNTCYSFEYNVPTLEEFTRRFTEITRQFPWLVWEEDGKVLGYAYGSAPFTRDAYRWCAESSIYLAPRIHSKGIGRKLYAALEEILKLQGYHKTYAIVTTANEASLAFHKAVGFRFVASMPGCGYKAGQLHGITWLEKELTSEKLYDHFPRSVTSFPQFYDCFL